MIRKTFHQNRKIFRIDLEDRTDLKIDRFLVGFSICLCKQIFIYLTAKLSIIALYYK